MKAATSDASPVQFQTVYVSAGESWAASGTNFAGFNNLINDGCGLYRGRLILPYEHLSRFQNDLI